MIADRRPAPSACTRTWWLGRCRRSDLRINGCATWGIDTPLSRCRETVSRLILQIAIACAYAVVCDRYGVCYAISVVHISNAASVSAWRCCRRGCACRSAGCCASTSASSRSCRWCRSGSSCCSRWRALATRRNILTDKRTCSRRRRSTVASIRAGYRARPCAAVPAINT